MTVSWQVRTEKTALMVHDLVNEMADEKGLFYDPSIKEVLQNTRKLIDACRARGIALVYAVPGWEKGDDFGRVADFYPEIPAKGAMMAGTWSVAVHPSIAPQKGDLVVTKKRMGAFYGTRLHQTLKRKGIDTIIITGTSTAIGCDVTARDAMNRDYKAIVVTDACLTRAWNDLGFGPATKEEVARVHFSSLARAFAMVVDTARLLKMIKES